jgi:hypothetical protein
MNEKRAHRTKGVLAALVAAAVCVPAAQARVDEDVAGKQPTAQVDARHMALLRDRPARTAGRGAPRAPVPTPDTRSDLEWGDAGIGAATVLGLGLLVGGGVLAGRRLARA